MKINYDNMKDLITKFKNKLFIPICILIITYCLFINELKTTSYYLIISYILVACGIFLIIVSLLELQGYLNKKEKVKKNYHKPDNFLDFLYVYSGYIINFTFYIYFFLYLIFQLDRISIAFNYLLLVIFGIFIGYRIAIKAYSYIDRKR